MPAEGRRWAVGAALAVLVVVVLAAIAAALTYSTVFAVDRIRVEGATHLSVAQVIAAAGLEGDVNVFHLDTDAVETMLESDPWVAESRVIRRLPNTIIVRVDEREPVVIVDERVLAADATVLPAADPTGLPVVRDAFGMVSPDGGAAAAQAASALDAALRARVPFIVVRIDGELELRLADGTVVRWGTGGGDREKASSLEAFLDYARERGRIPVRVDVSVPGAPSATFADR